MDTTQHLAALASTYEDALAEIARKVEEAHAAIDGEAQDLRSLGDAGFARPPLIPNVPIDEPPPYVPPPASMSHSALIPDTPLVDSPLSSSSLAFDDAPLWQS